METRCLASSLHVFRTRKEFDLKLSPVIIFASLSFFLLGMDVSAAPASEVQLFHKCYAHLTGTRAPFNHRVLSLVQTGAMTAVQGCMAVFDLAQLNSSGLTVGETNPQNAQDVEDAKNTLREFQNFHKTWFPSQTFRDSLNTVYDHPYQDIISSYEIANLVSYILFKSDQPYENLVTGVRTVKEIRDSVPSVGKIFGTLPTPFRHTFVAGFPEAIETFTPLFLEVGRLRGFRPLTSGEMNQTIRMRMPSNVSFPGGTFPSTVDPLGVNYSDNPNIDASGSHKDLLEVPYRKPVGGGGIGNVSYLLLNLGAGGNTYPRATGGTRTWRRMVANVYRDLMCRSLPVINPADAAPFVIPPAQVVTTGPYPTPIFRANQSCMTCHASIDGGAGVFRNLNIGEINAYPFNAPNDSTSPRNVVVGIFEHPTAYVSTGAAAPLNRLRRMKREGATVSYLPAESNIFSVNYSSQFFLKEPKGKVIYRDINDQLIQQDVQGVEDFGQTLSQIDDLYVCAAKRYFKFMTGYDASMLPVPSASAEEISARDFVIQIGKELKTHQSLRTLINDIVSSDFFKDGVR